MSAPQQTSGPRVVQTQAAQPQPAGAAAASSAPGAPGLPMPRARSRNPRKRDVMMPAHVPASPAAPMASAPIPLPIPGSSQADGLSPSGGFKSRAQWRFAFGTHKPWARAAAHASRPFKALPRRKATPTARTAR